VARGAPWQISDDSVMALATAEALGNAPAPASLAALMPALSRGYAACLGDMTARAPGKTTMRALRVLAGDPDARWRAVPFNRAGGGAGGAMRAAPVGLRFRYPSQFRELVACAVACAMLTHNHPDGYMGAVCAALGTSLGLEGVHPSLWARVFAAAMPVARRFATREYPPAARERALHEAAWDAGVFASKLRLFADARGLRLDDDDDADRGGDGDCGGNGGVDSGSCAAAGCEANNDDGNDNENNSDNDSDHNNDGNNENENDNDNDNESNNPALSLPTASTPPAPVTFPAPYGVPQRDAFYRALSWRGVNAGSSGGCGGSGWQWLGGSGTVGKSSFWGTF
jgi:hypothetical protein